MKTIFVNRFDNGWADSRYNRDLGKFAVSKHFDILTYPYRLYPLRGMAADTANTGIGNIIIGSDGNFYGMGVDTAHSAPTLGALWKRGSSGWTQNTNTGTISDAVVYNLLVEYHDVSGNRRIFFGGNNEIAIIDPADIAVATTHSLSYTNISQGFVHPKNDILYIPHDNKIAQNDNGTWTDVALELPANYRITALSMYGNYIAIACCPSINGVDYGGGGASSSANNSIVYLWDGDTSLTTLAESIDWGTGNLKVLGNLDGLLIGISDVGGSGGGILDYDSIQIKGYSGTVPALIKEITTQKETTTIPDASINSRVSFIYRGRFYFSIDITSGSTSPSYHGLWSLGKSKVSGQYAVTLERVATTDNSEIAVIAAAIIGDKCCMVYDSEGTLSFTNTTASIGDQWTATSVHETLINPNMDAADYQERKKLGHFMLNCVLPSSTAQVVVKVRIDSADPSAWKTLLTKTTTSPTMNAMFAETGFIADVSTVPEGYNFEFRLESTGGAEITGYGYRYDTILTL